MAAVALVALTLCGCVAEPPPGMSEADLADFNEGVLDKTWQRTGLDGAEERPEAGEGDPLSEQDWYTAMGECMNDGGVASFGTSYSPATGFEYVDGSGLQRANDAVQLLFYGCVARHPMIPGDNIVPLTDEQLDYIYDYYQRSLVPCMIMNGYTPSAAPTRVEFRAIAGQWSPYYSVDVGITGTQFDEIVRICGPERPELY